LTQFLQTSERHMNVVYRRRNKDDLWRRDDEEDEAGQTVSSTEKLLESRKASGEGDEAQLKVCVLCAAQKIYVIYKTGFFRSKSRSNAEPRKDSIWFNRFLLEQIL
jgi:hypothetical protein